jgi:hypothetical protein
MIDEEFLWREHLAFAAFAQLAKLLEDAALDGDFIRRQTVETCGFDECPEDPGQSWHSAWFRAGGDARLIRALRQIGSERLQAVEKAFDRPEWLWLVVGGWQLIVKARPEEGTVCVGARSGG